MPSGWRWARAARLAFALVLAGCGRGQDVERATPQGPLLGELRDGVERYLGIPYARPPIGERRWRAPEPIATPWQEPRDAREFAAACVQGAKPSTARGSQEDCLYLNVWSPAGARDRPVMVWIHGGGQMLGSANEPAYDGETLAREQDVVVVSLNFRLGYLGFLALDGTGSGETLLGNQGFLDQLAALRWVQEQIADFGGDPHRVTVFGESGGGVSTCLLLSSPLSAGLIHRAIMQSGTCGIQRVMSPDEARAQSRAFMRKIGCDRAGDALGCARGLSVSQFEARGLRPHSLLTMDSKAFSYYPLAVVDGDFLPADPLSRLRAGEFPNIPILIGTTLDEGSLFTGQRDFPPDATRYREDLEATIPGAGAELAALYPYASHLPIGEAYAAMFADAMEHCPANRVAALWSSRQPVYQYLFTQRPSAPLLHLMSLRHASAAADLGVFHGAEMPYVFGINSLIGHVWTDDQKAARRLVMSYWANFARSGNPNGPGLPAWPAHTPSEPHFVELAHEVRTHRALRAQACAFWDRHRDFSYW